MIDKTEAQPEALELADRLIGNAQIDECEGCNPVVVALERSAAAELRRQHAEIQQLKAQLSARQAAPDGWRLVPELATLNMLNTAFGICTQNGRPVQQMIESAAAKYAAMLSAAPPPPEREPQTDEQIEAAYKNLQVRRKKDQDEAFQAGIGKICMHCSEGHYQADWNGYSTFHRCDKCRHVPFDLSGLVKKSAASCWCETCRPVTLSDMRMVLCPDCGNKRCPKATHHDNACTNSNAPGQPGSSWGHVKPHGATNDNP